jgi:hypothetical protein
MSASRKAKKPKTLEWWGGITQLQDYHFSIVKGDAWR